MRFQDNHLSHANEKGNLDFIKNLETAYDTQVNNAINAAVFMKCQDLFWYQIVCEVTPNQS